MTVKWHEQDGARLWRKHSMTGGDEWEGFLHLTLTAEEVHHARHNHPERLVLLFHEAVKELEDKLNGILAKRHDND